jgi:hypothetical protein
MVDIESNNSVLLPIDTILTGQHCLSILQESFGDHRELRQDLQQANFECAVRHLKNYKKDGGLQAAASLISNLEKCLNGQPGYQLFKEQLVYNQGGFKSQQVTEIGKNIGFSNLWQRVCACQEIEDYTAETTVDTRVTRLIALWNAVFEERDLVVHRISQANGWASNRIQQAIDLSKLVVKRIATCLTIDADELIAKIASKKPAD